VLSDRIVGPDHSKPARPSSTGYRPGRGGRPADDANEIALNILLASLTIVFPAGRGDLAAVRV